VGLTLYYSQGSQAAEDEKLMVYLGEPGDKPGSFYLNLIIFLFDESQPVERRGSKAVDLAL
jgi:hypothetical protein